MRHNFIKTSVKLNLVKNPKKGKINLLKTFQIIKNEDPDFVIQSIKLDKENK